MFEAILVIGTYMNGNSGLLTTIRYETIEQCQLAKQAVIDDPALKAAWWHRNIKDDVWCIPVPKEVK